MNLKTHLTLTLLIIIYNFCLAQNNFKEGYIIKNNNDTVQGWINFRSDVANQNECIFSLDQDGTKTQIYTPEELIGYRFLKSPGKFYISKVIDIPDAEKILDTQMAKRFLNKREEKQYGFVEYLVSGTMNLYYYVGKQDGVNYYIFDEKGQDLFL